MEVMRKAFGGYETNCYILKFNGFEFVIDPGYGAKKWVVESCKNPIAILLTHGHHDHIWDVKILKDYYQDITIYCPIQDTFMLEEDCFDLNLNTCSVDKKVENIKSEKRITIAGIDITYWHFPGHTPGCSMIEIGNSFFSGDFIFKRSIGRSDLPYSNDLDMKESLIRFLNIKRDYEVSIFPGHGDSTYLLEEQRHVPIWISRF